ncbi:MAG TPA: lysylphosphatidylglycerol synthase transmembrane domain-containing protein [Vicinamibacteria bacterium]|nr:lysylphosphatidylglycerol synthase transmembrane domain-containing protein [Vicinamibacteria bacterium]
MKRSALLIAKIAVSLALLAYLLSTTDLDALQRRVRAGDTFLLALAMALYAVILAISTWRWRTLLEAQGYTIPLAHLSGSYLVATFFNNFLPSNIGGDVVRVRDSSRLTGSTTTSLAVVAIDRILGLGALYVLALVAFLTGGPLVRGLAGARSVLLALGLVFGFLAYVFFRPGIARRVVSASGLARFPWAVKRFETVQSAVHVYRSRVHAVWLAFLGSVALQAIVVYYYFTVARALRIPLPLSACFLMVPLCTLVQTVPISFNGWGIRESVFILYFHQVGLGKDSALAFSLVGAGLIVLMSLSGALVWTARETTPADPAPPPGA